MKLLVSGDKHLGLVSDGMDRLSEQREVLRRTVELARLERPDVFVDLGDLFHVSRPSPEAYAVALTYALELRAWAMESNSGVYFLAGNHDKPTRGAVNALTPMEAVFSEIDPGAEYVLQFPTRVPGHGGVPDLIFLPHVTEWEAKERDFDSAQDLIDAFCADLPKRKRVVFSHLEIPGVDVTGVEDVAKRDTGLSVPAESISDRETLRTFAGHIHGYQELERVTIVGSAVYVDFGEADDPKGAILAEF